MRPFSACPAFIPVEKVTLSDKTFVDIWHFLVMRVEGYLWLKYIYGLPHLEDKLYIHWVCFVLNPESLMANMIVTIMIEMIVRWWWWGGWTMRMMLIVRSISLYYSQIVRWWDVRKEKVTQVGKTLSWHVDISCSGLWWGLLMQVFGEMILSLILCNWNDDDDDDDGDV